MQTFVQFKTFIGPSGLGVKNLFLDPNVALASADLVALFISWFDLC